MIQVIPFAALGRYEADWLSARHHFSFGDFHDPARMGFGPLRVWNDDTIQPDTGFPPHGHRDMEIITYVRTGAVTHGDHLGNQGRTLAGDVQVMSAGKGIVHSEYNREAEPTTLFQIWIQPNAQGLAPRWETKAFPKQAEDGLVVLASGRDQDRDSPALRINADAALLGATLDAGQSLEHTLAPGRRAYLVPARGTISVNGQPAAARDGVAVEAVERLVITATEDAEILLADLP
ncbi:MAG: hypothetical protein GC191_12235 [Azospirillum sp.]|nr:hypothetical protein [Azospirillum sp.]